MRGKKRNVAYYSKRIAKDTGLSEKVVHAVLMRMTQNLCTQIYRGNEIRIKKFGRIFFRK